MQIVKIIWEGQEVEIPESDLKHFIELGAKEVTKQPKIKTTKNN